jgi:molybdopterin/thiamine biosynthesis adenylyltransferase
MNFSDDQLERYSRAIIVNEIGGKGQAALLQARVLVIGAGGLGSPLLYYLVASGVGVIGIVDDDVVELSNLQRQIIHKTPTIGMLKTASSARTITELNPDCKVECHPLRLTAENAAELIGCYDVVADGSDNMATRLVVSDYCYHLKKPLISAAVRGFNGQIYTFKPYLEGDYPCYRCLYAPEAESAGGSCTASGVLASVAGVMGSLLATEVMKEIMGLGENMADSMLCYNGLQGSFRTSKRHRDPECLLCH